MDTFRRRLMMAAYPTGPVNPYPDPWVDDGKLWVYYNIESADVSTTIVSANVGDLGNTMEVDGVTVATSSSYTFSAPGEHLIKFTPGSTLPNYLFRYLTNVSRVYMPDTVTNFGNNGGVFQQCSNLTFIRFSTYLTRIAQLLCMSATSLVIKDLSLPYLTSELGSSSFTSTQIKKISSLGSITSIGNYSFRYCNSLTDVTLPATIQSIGNQAFYPSPIQYLTCEATNPPTLGGAAFYGNALIAVYVPAESVELYKAASGWSAFSNKIQAI